jgi:hypothetical protein
MGCKVCAAARGPRAENPIGGRVGARQWKWFDRSPLIWNVSSLDLRVVMEEQERGIRERKTVCTRRRAMTQNPEPLLLLCVIAGGCLGCWVGGRVVLPDTVSLIVPAKTVLLVLVLSVCSMCVWACVFLRLSLFFSRSKSERAAAAVAAGALQASSSR